MQNASKDRMDGFDYLMLGLVGLLLALLAALHYRDNYLYDPALDGFSRFQAAVVRTEQGGGTFYPACLNSEADQKYVSYLKVSFDRQIVFNHRNRKLPATDTALLLLDGKEQTRWGSKTRLDAIGESKDKKREMDWRYEIREICLKSVGDRLPAMQPVLVSLAPQRSGLRWILQRR